MKSLNIGLLFLLLIFSCKSDQQKTTSDESENSINIAKEIANAHGFENWKNVSKIEFSFQVIRDSVVGKGRSWTWKPQTNEVTMTAGEKTESYTRDNLNNINMAADRAFINDKFWLLIPFQLIWDTSATISESKKAEAPISKTELNMITLTYPKEGGYTPGDAYDIFYDDNYMIKEWVFRKGNSLEPSLTTTFENIKDYNGIKIATDHKREGGKWNLNFTDIIITMK